MAKPGPIVITLKKRLGPARRLEDEDEAVSGITAEPLGDLGSGGALGVISRSRSRSRKRSPSPLEPIRKGSSSPLEPLRTSAIAASSVLNVAALEDIFGRFHGQLDTWLQAESGKLERAEARGDSARGELRQCAEQVCEFLREHAPKAHAELGSDPAGDGFASRALPKFLEAIDEDRRALQEASAALAAFADRKFPKSEELAGLKEDVSPLPLLKALLRMLASPPKGGPPRGRQNGDDP
uniref:Uncharacterized protein n=1 Tax=Alexandrium monilatum TaxID=311494 RepID=A0A7S4S349_9DINO